MGLKDTAKCMGVLLPFLVRGTWAGMKLSISYQTLTKAKCCWMKVKVLSQHPCSNLCFQTPVPQKSILPEVWPTLPASVYHLQGLGAPQTLAEDVSLLGHHIPYQRWPLSSGVLQCSPVWLGVSSGDSRWGSEGFVHRPHFRMEA